MGNTTVTIEYERPSARKRQIFGALVPWNTVWRTGAGRCTRIKFDKGVNMGGQQLDPGTYSIFTIPNPKKWIVIVNRDTTLYGSGFYDSKKDVARFVATPTKSNRFYETLTFDIEILPNDARIFMSWGNVQVVFDLETTTDREIEKYIQTELLTKKNKDSDRYARAAEYLFFQGENFSDALKLSEYAIELDNNRWGRGLKIKVYKRLKLYDNALEEINEYLQNYRTEDLNEEQQKHVFQYLTSEHKKINSLIEETTH